MLLHKWKRSWNVLKYFFRFYCFQVDRFCIRLNSFQLDYFVLPWWKVKYDGIRACVNIPLSRDCTVDRQNVPCIYIYIILYCIFIDYLFTFTFTNTNACKKNTGGHLVFLVSNCEFVSNNKWALSLPSYQCYYTSPMYPNEETNLRPVTYKLSMLFIRKLRFHLLVKSSLEVS